ncbi:SURF1 family cytochrome oxidase biogenesis protein [Streptomyces lonarensis]|uniref:SURF1-like protein n=1 Tax=Streptomyces lonarensis TaxID=700599 RepID=A0A7X6D5L2_9ACTN|nr:SURF1 family protein [Streptomyces lonarensis]NJQ08631.1 SURF1 family protein [Streptomyces lonarensis]
MFRVLLSRQWVMLTLVALLLIPAFIWAGNWQYDRHDQRVARNELIGGSLAAPPVPMSELSAPGEAPDPDDRFRGVTATGRFDASQEVVARSRTGNQKGVLGYFVLTPLVPDEGPAVLVNRGFVPAGNDPTRMPEVPPAPEGEVTVTGRLMVDETTETTGIRDTQGLPEGMVMLVNSEQRAEAAGMPFLSGHMVLTELEPELPDGAEEPERLAAPGHSGIGAHFAYALQWWLFAAMVPVGWWILLRRELADAAAGEGGSDQGPAGPAPGRGPDTPADSGPSGGDAADGGPDAPREGDDTGERNDADAPAVGSPGVPAGR